MARIIRVNGNIEELPDSDFDTLEKMQAAVGGYIAIIAYRGKLVCLCDEDGMMKDKPINQTASMIIERAVLGDVLIIDKCMLN